MARLDRLAPVKEIAQLGATLGREFSYEVLHAVFPADEGSLQQGLRQLVEVELLYQRGLPPQATYLFKHALIQDTAYQSLLKSKRRQYHQQIAQVLEEQFPETKETQPELVAHHYTEAGLIAQAIPYWHQAGQRAIARSANTEAIGHLSKGLEVLKTMPDTPECAQQELALQTTLGTAFMATKGYAAPEVVNAYARARELSSQLGEGPQLASVLFGLWTVYHVGGKLQTAYEVAQQLMRLAQNVQDPALLLEAHHLLGETQHFRGEFPSAFAHLEQNLALYNPQYAPSVRRTHDLGVMGLCYTAWNLWYLGFPDQALKRCEEALALARELSHPFSLAFALNTTAQVHLYRREWKAAQEWAEAESSFAEEKGFALFIIIGSIYRGWALVEQGHGTDATNAMHQGLTAYGGTGAEAGQPLILLMLAQAHGKVGQPEKGLTLLTEALEKGSRSGERRAEAELYRLKGVLTLQKLQVSGSKFQVQKSSASGVRSLESEVEGCFLRAIEIARKQQAKSLELRAVMSLARLWQRQDKRADAHQMLSEVYNWFTEGFDTKDLQDARALLDELS